MQDHRLWAVPIKFFQNNAYTGADNAHDQPPINGFRPLVKRGAIEFIWEKRKQLEKSLVRVEDADS
jgi:hypothetical protein